MSDIPPSHLSITVVPDSVGGQRIGTSRAVSITHLPSGITVTVGCGHSQHRNKAIAMDAILGALTSPHYRE